jgi:predicted DCC family thiol-disulfide oxidoreductase YuxK
MTNAADNSSDIMLIFDGACPLCRNYSQAVRIRQSLGPLHLVNARNDAAICNELQRRQLDIDQGMVLKLGDNWHHGAEAIHMLAMISSRSGLFNRFHYWLFKSPGRTKFMYPFLRACRNALLTLLAKTKINQ